MELTKSLTFLAGLLLGGALGQDHQPRADCAAHIIQPPKEVVEAEEPAYDQHNMIGFVPHLVQMDLQ